MSGTTFKAQKIITESILTESPELIETIISNPEVRKFGEFKAREFVIQNTLTPAYIVITDSEELAEKISFRYVVYRDRIIPMPFSHSPFISELPLTNSKEILELYKLDYGYFFYPSQFWPHKNHLRIIEAARLLHEEGIKCRIVFVGEDSFINFLSIVFTLQTFEGFLLFQTSVYSKF